MFELNSSIVLLAILAFASFIGIILAGAIGYFAFKKYLVTRNKLVGSTGVAFATILLWITICVDIGIYFAFHNNNLKSALVTLPLLLCGIFVFPIVFGGTYLQLIYREKIEKFINTSDHI